MKTKLALAIGLAICTRLAFAQGASVTISGEVAPGVYGRVDIGTRPPPPMLYRQPILILKPVNAGPPPSAIYMHVPPGHAKNWSKHCKKYNACGQPVYFVKSAEYEPGYKNPGKGQGKGKGKD